MLKVLWVMGLAFAVSTFAKNALADGADTLDVDGDGLADTAAVTPGGRLRVVLAAGATLPELPGFGTPLREATVTLHLVDGHRVLAVRGVGEDGARTVELFEWFKGALIPMWSGFVGPQGRDGEWTRTVEVEPTQVVFYDETPAVTRCDGVPARLNAQRYDFRTRGFVGMGPVSTSGPAMPRGGPRPAPTLPTLLFQRGAPPGLEARTRPRLFRFQAASTTADDGGSAAYVSRPRELDDDDATTVWAEARAGDGSGEFVTARNGTARSALVRALRLIPGDASSRRAFLETNRVRRIHVVASDELQFLVEMPRDPASEPARFGEPFWVVFPVPLPVSCVTVVLEATYPGSQRQAGGRTAISELVVLTNLDGGSEGDLAELAAIVAAGRAPAGDAENVLLTYGPAGAQALVSVARQPDRSEAEKRRLRLALARIGDPLGAEEMALGLRDELHDGERKVYEQGLTRMGEAAVPALAALLRDDQAPLPARKTAAMLLGQAQGAPARTALASLLGQGERSLRRSLVLAMGGRSATELGQIIETLAAESAPTDGRSSAPLREADLWHVARLLARRAPAAAAETAVRAAVRRWATVEAFETRYRLIELMALRPSVPEAAAALTRLVREEPEPVLRLAAAASASAVTGLSPQAASLLGQALGDPDPGVRVAAALGLSDREDDPGTDRARIERLRSDAWPMVRKAVAGGLGASCQRKAPADALFEAAASDPDDEVRRAALGALVRCKEPRVGESLLTLLRDTHAQVSLRAHAALLLGELGDPRYAARLVAELAALRAESRQRERVLRVAIAATRALGKLQDPAAEAALLGALADATVPALQAAAADALGQLCPTGARAALERAQSSQDSVVVRAARLALKVCAR